MQSLLNYFRHKNNHSDVPETLITGDLICHSSAKAPAVKARLEARLKKDVDPSVFQARQERAANFRSELVRKRLVARQERRVHATEIKKNLTDQRLMTAVRQAREDQRLFAAQTRRQ